MGNFVELETIVDGVNFKEVKEEHENIKIKLGLNNFESISVSYVDLIKK